MCLCRDSEELSTPCSCDLLCLGMLLSITFKIRLFSYTSGILLPYKSAMLVRPWTRLHNLTPSFLSLHVLSQSFSNYFSTDPYSITTEPPTPRSLTVNNPHTQNNKAESLISHPSLPLSVHSFMQHSFLMTLISSLDFVSNFMCLSFTSKIFLSCAINQSYRHQSSTLLSKPQPSP